MGRASDAARSHVDLARIGFGIGDEFGKGLGRERWRDHDNERSLADARDWRDVAHELKLRFGYSVALTALVETGIRMVYPSAAEFTTYSVPMLPPKPGLFSITNCWPRRSDSHCPASLPIMSGPLPAGNVTIKDTGFAG